MSTHVFPLPAMNSYTREKSSPTAAGLHEYTWLFLSLLVPGLGVAGCGLLAWFVPEITAWLFGGPPSGLERAAIVALILSPMALASAYVELLAQKLLAADVQRR